MLCSQGWGVPEEWEILCLIELIIRKKEYDYGKGFE